MWNFSFFQHCLYLPLRGSGSSMDCHEIQEESDYLLLGTLMATPNMYTTRFAQVSRIESLLPLVMAVPLMNLILNVLMQNGCDWDEQN